MAIIPDNRRSGIVKVNPDGTSKLLTTQKEIAEYYESMKNDGKGPMPFVDPEISKQPTKGLDSALQPFPQVRSVENPLTKILETAFNYNTTKQQSQPAPRSAQNKSVENPLIGILEAARNYKPKQVEINTSPFATEDETRRMYTNSMMNNEKQKEIEDAMIKSYNLNPNLDTVVWPGKSSPQKYSGRSGGTFDLPVSTDPWMTPEEIAARSIQIPYRAGAEPYPQLDNNGKIVKPKQEKKSLASGSGFKGSRSVPNALPEIAQDTQPQSQGRLPADDNVFTRVDMSPLQRLLDVQESKQAVENNRQAPATFQDPSTKFLSAEELNALRTRTQASKLESALASEKLKADVDSALRANALGELQAMITGLHYDKSNSTANRKIDSDERMKAAELAAERAKKKAETETDYLQKLAPYYTDYQKSGIPSKRPRTTDEFVGGIAEMTNKYRQLDEELALQRKMNQLPEIDIALKMHEIKNRGR